MDTSWAMARSGGVCVTLELAGLTAASAASIRQGGHASPDQTSSNPPSGVACRLGESVAHTFPWKWTGRRSLVFDGVRRSVHVHAVVGGARV